MTDQDDGKPVDGTNLYATVFSPFDGSFHIVTNAIPRGSNPSATEPNPLHKKTYPASFTLADLLIELQLSGLVIKENGNFVLSRKDYQDSFEAEDVDLLQGVDSDITTYDIPKYFREHDPNFTSGLLAYCKSNLETLFENQFQIHYTGFLVNFTKMIHPVLKEETPSEEESPLEKILYSPRLKELPSQWNIRCSAYDLLAGMYAMEELVKEEIIGKKEGNKELYLVRN